MRRQHCVKDERLILLWRPKSMASRCNKYVELQLSSSHSVGDSVRFTHRADGKCRSSIWGLLSKPMADNSAGKRINGGADDRSPRGQTPAVSVTQRELIEMKRYASRIQLKCSGVQSRRAGSAAPGFTGHSMDSGGVRSSQVDPQKRPTDRQVRTGRDRIHLSGEDDDQSVFVLIDGRVPMSKTSQESSTSVLAARLASLLGWAACEQGNRLGGEIFTPYGHQHVMPSRGIVSVIRLINMLIAAQENVESYDTEIDRAAAASAFDDALLRLNETEKSSSLVFILSNFRLMNVVAERQLIRLSRRNTVVAVLLYDALERALRKRCHYRNRSLFQTRRNRLMHLVNRYAISLITCSTADDPFDRLRAHFCRDRGVENDRQQ